VSVARRKVRVAVEHRDAAGHGGKFEPCAARP
jgi:hypothetical protein